MAPRSSRNPDKPSSVVTAFIDNLRSVRGMSEQPFSPASPRTADERELLRANDVLRDMLWNGEAELQKYKLSAEERVAQLASKLQKAEFDRDHYFDELMRADKDKQGLMLKCEHLEEQKRTERRIANTCDEHIKWLEELLTQNGKLVEKLRTRIEQLETQPPEPPVSSEPESEAEHTQASRPEHTHVAQADSEYDLSNEPSSEELVGIPLSEDLNETVSIEPPCSAIVKATPTAIDEIRRHACECNLLLLSSQDFQNFLARRHRLSTEECAQYFDVLLRTQKISSSAYGSVSTHDTGTDESREFDAKIIASETEQSETPFQVPLAPQIRSSRRKSLVPRKPVALTPVTLTPVALNPVASLTPVAPLHPVAPQTPVPPLTPLTPQTPEAAQVKQSRSFQYLRRAKSLVSLRRPWRAREPNLRTTASGSYMRPTSSSERPLPRHLMGEMLYKYHSGLSLSGGRHKRLFWLHPSTNRLFWRPEANSILPIWFTPVKSVAVHSVEEVIDLNELPLHRSILVHGERDVRVTCLNGEEHRIWLTALQRIALGTPAYPP